MNSLLLNDIETEPSLSQKRTTLAVRSTLQQFLNEPAGGNLTNNDSTLTMRVKAAALFESATNLSGEWNPCAYWSGFPGSL